jgi:hypothetical protein
MKDLGQRDFDPKETEKKVSAEKYFHLTFAPQKGRLKQPSWRDGSFAREKYRI